MYSLCLFLAKRLTIANIVNVNGCSLLINNPAVEPVV